MSGFLTSLGLAAGSGLINAIGSIFSSNRQQQQSKELMDYQAGLQRKQQAFFNQQQYPQMLNSMRMAGLNPNFGNGVQQGTNAGMPSASAGKVDSPTIDMASAANAYSQLKLNDAQADLLRTEADRNRALTEGQDIENQTAYDRIYTQLEELKSRSWNNRASASLTESTIDKVKQEVSNLKSQQKKMLAEIGNITAMTQLSYKEIAIFDRKMNAEISNILANANYMSNQDKREARMLFPKIFNINSITRMNNSTAYKQQVEKEFTDFLLKQAQKYDDAERVINMGTQLMNSASKLVDSFTPF